MSINVFLLDPYKSLLPQCCVNKCFLLDPYTSLLPQCGVKNCFLLDTYTSLLPQYCVNKCFFTGPLHFLCCHSAVSIIVFTGSLHFLAAAVLCQKECFYWTPTLFLLPQCCVNKCSFNWTPRLPCCHSAVSISVFTEPLHILTVTVLCQ